MINTPDSYAKADARFAVQYGQLEVPYSREFPLREDKEKYNRLFYAWVKYFKENL